MTNAQFVNAERFGALLAVLLLIASGDTSSAQELLFPATEWGNARLALPQSASQLESLFQVTEDNFEPLAAFSAQSPFRNVATPVGRLDILARDRQGRTGIIVCTASLVSENRALTNHHCIPGTEGMRLLEAQLRMGYLSDRGKTGDTYPVSLIPIETDAALDYSIVEVGNHPTAKYGTIAIGMGTTTAPGEDLFIIHHPLGKPMQLTRKDCRAVSWKMLNPNEIDHRCDTLAGSSGAPIFSLISWKAVGLHFQGGLSKTQSYNSGKRLDSIIKRSATLQTLARSISEPTSTRDDQLARCDVLHADLRSRCLAARNGDSEAQTLLGHAFHLGDRVKKDDEAAAYWYKRAAIQGHKEAQTSLGYLYEKGYGVPMDRDRSVYWTRQGAKSGEMVAQLNLGEAYELGTGVAINFALAEYWYRKAAGQGSANANERLTYLRGTGEQFFQRGYFYYLKGADFYNDAVYWYEKSARQGHAPAMVNLGYMYRRGLGLRKDDAEAARWYREAAEANNMVAQYNLGVLYENGWGVRENASTARKWYERSARQNYEEAKKALARLGQ